MKDHLDIMRMVKRKRLSEDRLRKLNMYEIVEEIHGLEDSNKALLDALEGLLEVASLGPIGLAAKYGPDVDERALWEKAGQNAADAIKAAK